MSPITEAIAYFSPELQARNVSANIISMAAWQRLDKAAEKKQCGRGWVGTKPPGCKRASSKGKAKSTAKAKKRTQRPSARSNKQTPKQAAASIKQESGIKVSARKLEGAIAELQSTMMSGALKPSQLDTAARDTLANLGVARTNAAGFISDQLKTAAQEMTEQVAVALAQQIKAEVVASPTTSGKYGPDHFKAALSKRSKGADIKTLKEQGYRSRGSFPTKKAAIAMAAKLSEGGRPEGYFQVSKIGGKYSLMERSAGTINRTGKSALSDKNLADLRTHLTSAARSARLRKNYAEAVAIDGLANMTSEIQRAPIAKPPKRSPKRSKSAAKKAQTKAKGRDYIQKIAPKWMQGHDGTLVIAHALDTGEPIKTGWDIGLAHVKRLNPPSKKYRYGSASLVSVDGAKKETIGLAMLSDQVRGVGTGAKGYTAGESVSKAAQEKWANSDRVKAARAHMLGDSPKRSTKSPKAKSSRGLKSPAVQQVIDGARTIKPSELKRGQQVKFMTWGRVGSDGILSLQEREVKITSVKADRVTFKPIKPNAGGQRPSSSLSIDKELDRVAGGQFHPTGSQPVDAFRLAQAQQSEQELPKLKQELRNATAEADKLLSDKSIDAETAQGGRQGAGMRQHAVSARILAAERIRAAENSIKLGKEVAAKLRKTKRSDSLSHSALKSFHSIADARGWNARTRIDAIQWAIAIAN